MDQDFLRFQRIQNLWNQIPEDLTFRTGSKQVLFLYTLTPKYLQNENRRPPILKAGILGMKNR